jgi:hypothetical protein
VYVHVFIGPANLAADVGQAVALVDARFPRLTQPETFGLYIDPEDSATLDFDIAVPQTSNVATIWETASSSGPKSSLTRPVQS